jgi:hypothetical protein
MAAVVDSGACSMTGTTRTRVLSLSLSHLSLNHLSHLSLSLNHLSPISLCASPPPTIVCGVAWSTRADGRVNQDAHVLEHGLLPSVGRVTLAAVFDGHSPGGEFAADTARTALIASFHAACAGQGRLHLQYEAASDAASQAVLCWLPMLASHAQVADGGAAPRGLPAFAL